MSLFRLWMLNVLISLLLLGGTAHAASQQHADRMIARQAVRAAPMSAADLRKLYAGRSWIWKTGAGFFSAKGRHFVAWSHTGKEKSYARGRWYTTNGGKMCMSAVWYSRKYAARDVSCFLHREKAGVIYQKRAPNGKWYVFRHSPTKRGDEVLKLHRGDYVKRHLRA